MKKSIRKVYAVTFAIMLFVSCITTGCGKNNAQLPENSGRQSSTTETDDNAAAKETSAQAQVKEPGKDSISLSDTDSKIAEILSSMSTRQKVAQMIMPDIRLFGEGDEKVGVTELNKELTECITENQFGGVILFAQNILDAEQTLELTNALQQANADGGAASRLFISVDQEGGLVTRLATGTQMPGNMALGATGDPELAKKAGEIIGQELSACGINLDFAPDTDVNDNPENPIIGIRSFSDDPKMVGEYGSAYVSGLHNAGTMACVKHFPGHGNTETDSHTGFPTVDKTKEEVENCELVPFKRIAPETDFIMTAHIRFPQLTGNTDEKYISIDTGEEVILPATLSKTILTDILRGELGYEGIIITDAMDMDAVAQHFDPLDSAKLAINAGVDIMLMPVNISDKQGIADMESYLDNVTAMASQGEIPAERLDESVTRILKTKAKYGLLEAWTSESGSSFSYSTETVGSKEHHDAEWDISLKAMTLTKNEGALPIEDGKKVVIAYPQTAQELSMKFALEKLKNDGVLSNTRNVSYYCYDGKDAASAVKNVKGADVVIAISAINSISNMDPASEKGQKAAYMDALIEAVHTDGGKFVLICSGLPYEMARFSKADAFLACYGARGMTSLPGDYSGNTPQYGSGIPAAIYTAFGGSSPTGKLPVDVHEITSSFEYTDKVVFPRGTGLTY